MTRKESFARKIMDAVASIAQASDDGDNLVTVYFDRGYGSGGADPIQDSDLTELGINATQLAGGITFFQNLVTMLNNGVPTQSDYDTILNTLRNDI